MRYEHEIVREIPVERPLVVPAKRAVIVVDPEGVLEGVLPAGDPNEERLAS
ncbi:MAG: hypothetical protein WD965_05725 [Actinomycetota bacterium]